jgi:hypothetical protein
MEHLMTIPMAGEDVYLGSILSNVHLWGIISDLDTPSMMSGSFEILGNDGAITLDALVGPKGNTGANAPIVDMQWDEIDDPADLPDNLTDDDTDIGKAWWIGNQVYVWDGNSYQMKAMGTQGPPGPVPNITPTVELLDPDDDDLETTVEVTGTAANPGWHMKLKAPKGPQGDNATIRDASDYSETDSGAPQVGDTITWDGTQYSPQQVGSVGGAGGPRVRQLEHVDDDCAALLPAGRPQRRGHPRQRCRRRTGRRHRGSHHAVFAAPQRRPRRGVFVQP